MDTLIASFDLPVPADAGLDVLGVRHDSRRVEPGDLFVAVPGELFDGRPVGQPMVLRGGSGAEPNLVEQTWKIDALNSAMLTYLDQAAAGRRRTIVAGGLRYAEFARQVEFQEGVKEWDTMGGYDYPGGPAQMTLTVWDPQGKRVAPGETWRSEDTFYLDFATTDPFESLERFGETMAKANSARPNVYDFPTLCGWMASSGRWNSRYSQFLTSLTLSLPR